MRGSSGWDIPQRQATNLSPVGHEAVIAPSPLRQHEHFEPPALVAAAVPGVISAQFSVVSPGKDCTSSDKTRIIREMIAICLSSLPANFTVGSPEHIGQSMCWLVQP